MTPYFITKTAAQDMEDIFLYIAQDNLDAAEKLETDFFKAFEMLAEHPHVGRERPDLTAENCLFWSVRRRYFVIYQNVTPLTIIRVVSANRDLAILLQEL